MKILIAGTTGDSMPPPYAGVQKVSLRFAKMWREMGHKVGMVFVYKPENADDLGAGARYFFEYNSKPTKFKKIFSLLILFFSNPLLYFRLLWEYIKIYPHFSREAVLYSSYGILIDDILESFKPDVVLLEGALIKAFMAGKVAKYRGLPVLIDTYAEIRDPGIGVNKHLDEKGREKYWSGFLQVCDYVITLTNCSDGALKYLPKDKVKVFFDTCDFTLFHSEVKETKTEIRKFFELPEDKLLVGMVGAFELRKGHDYLIKALAVAAKNGSQAVAVFCGGSGDYSKWQDLAKAEGVADRVYFFKNISEADLVRLYHSLDVYCNLSNTPRSCGFDLSLLEGMASGLPLIVYDNGQLSEAVKEKNGFVFPLDDITGVAEAIIKFEGMTPSELKTMGDGSVSIAKEADIRHTSELKIGWLQEAIIANQYKKR